MMHLHDAGVRTTVNIDDHLLAEAKVIAARGHRSLGDVINDALRYAFVERTEGTRAGHRVALPVDGGSGLQPGIDLQDRGSLAAALGDDAAIRAPSWRQHLRLRIPDRHRAPRRVSKLTRDTAVRGGTRGSRQSSPHLDRPHRDQPPDLPGAVSPPARPRILLRGAGRTSGSGGAFRRSALAPVRPAVPRRWRNGQPDPRCRSCRAGPRARCDIDLDRPGHAAVARPHRPSPP